MNSKFEKLLASLLAVAVLFSCIMITGIASSEDEDVVSVEDMFAASLGAEVGETYIDTDYSASGATVDGWSVGAIGTGNLLKKIGLKLRNRNGAKISEYDAPNSNFVAKLTVYRTDDLYGIQVGTYSNTAAKATYARIVDADYAAGNKLRFYPNANPTPNYTVTLSDSYDLDDKNKAITLYLFSYNGTVYFVDCDGVKLFEYVGAADKIYLNASYCELILTEFSVKALTTLTGVSITYNANGGAFSGGSEKVTIKENIGEKLTAEIPYRENHRFLGWSKTADGEVLTDTTATAELSGKTLYAVWQAAHPADGNYTTGSVIDVDFSDWVVASNNNSYNGNDADGKTIDFFSDKLTENGDGEGDIYIRMDTTQITSTVPGLGYYPNFALTMTDNGKTDNTLILDNDTTYKLTLRVRINELNGATAELRVFYSYLKSCQSGNGRANNMSKLVTGIGETNGEWVDIVSYFTTPKKYTDNDNTKGNICDKIYIALGPTTSALVQYDITNVKIEYASKASMYYELSGETILYDTLYGTPGETLDLPESIAEEFYSDEDATGGIKTYNFNKWSYGSDYNEEFIPKFGNVDTVFYCKDISEHYSSTENQDGFCGFDVYGEQLTDYSYDVNAASISAEKAYTGDKSMLVSSDTAFEIRNDNAINIYKGKTYRVSFFYTSEEPLKVGVGVGKANSVASSAKATESVSLAASKEWKKSTVFITVPYGTAEGYALALIADISSVAYFDNITVSSAANAVGAEKEDGDLRFMFTYDTDVNSDNTVIIDGESYTVAERGILVKDPTNSAELVKDNYGKNGVVGTVRTEMDNCFTYNSVTGSVVFSVIIDGVGETDKLSARGYVVLSDGTVYYTDVFTAALSDVKDAIETIPATITVDEADETAYVYLPAGTEISSDAPAATYYSDFFTEETDVVSNGIMQKGAYVNFSEETSFENLTVPAELGYTVEIGTRDELYYGPDVSVVKKQLNAQDDSNVNYIFITDIHYSGYGTENLSQELRDGAIDRQMNRIVKFTNENDAIDFVVVGGDLTTGQYTSAESCMRATEKGIAALKNCEKPVFILMGNHDDNSYGFDTRESTDMDFVLPHIISDKFWKDRILDVFSPKDIVHSTKHAESKYFYYDLEDKKTRIVCLDSSDKEAEYDENGVVTGLKLLDPSKSSICTQYKTGYSYYGYSEKQIEWLATEALTADDGWNYVFFSHMGTASSYYFGSEIKNIISAYQNKTLYSFEGEEVTVNVTFDDSGKIMIYQHGHVHAGGLKYDENTNLFTVNTQTANYRNASDETKSDRIYMTEAEALFDIMSVNDQAVNQMRVGYGNGIKFYYPN